MKALSRHPVRRRLATALLIASGVFGAASTTSVAAVLLDFEGVSLSHNYDGFGLNLGGYYGPKPGGPVFGPQATVLEVGGSVNSVIYPPQSGIGSLWGEGLDIEVTFATGLARSVSLYYRSNADLFLFAYDPFDNLLGSASGPASLGSDPAGLLTLDTGGYDVARVLISGPPGAFVIDDLSYNAIPEPRAYALVLGLGLAGVVWWRCRS